jgi:hypothetical protein
MLDKVEEAKFAALKDMCRSLKVVVPPEIFIEFKVVDKTGKLIFDDIQRGHSWTRNYYNFLCMLGIDSDATGSANFGAGYLSGKRTSASIDSTAGNSSTRAAVTAGYGTYNNAASSTFGIVVGTGNTAFSEDHFTLATLIAHGATTGLLTYSAMAAPIKAYNAGTMVWSNVISRLFNNNSGGAIVVAETGLYSNCVIGYNIGGIYFMLERSVLAPTINVPNGAQLTVTYTISMDFTAIDT